MFYFHSIHKKMSETYQKLAFTHPSVVLKSGLKNNWMKKLDRVNRPLGRLLMVPYKINEKTASTFDKLSAKELN